ncbi:MAG TPA: helix-turn-helix domain-containing protein [Pseudonocardiaceae bacterium]|jgi:AraC family transcriptional activator FtrA|nr:helix-turn-helix domain-containing protein [Pseudonocardiaceae bacterium]
MAVRPPPDRPHRVVALVRAPQGAFELGCVDEVFGTHWPDLPQHYTLTVCTEVPGPVRTSTGYELLVTEGLDAFASADTIIVPGWRPVDAPLSSAAKAALLAAHARGARLASICAGAFALAQTGLLDGRTATTHWARAAELAARFPRIGVDPDVLYVDHGDLATSAGAGAGIDLCLHLVHCDFGAAYAASVARHMVLPPHREGGQAQYAAASVAPPPQQSLAGLLDWVTGRLHEPVTVEDMAAHLHLSGRTLARRFTEQLGTSPGQWLLGQRINAARVLLETSDLSVEAIAARVGLVSATNLRRRFHRALRTTPAAYRRSFRPSGVGRASLGS